METPLGDVQFEKKPSGVFIVDGNEAGHTLQCCHCGAHYVSIRGSGIRRGFCKLCNQVTCGKEVCNMCVPFEEKLNIMEGKKLKDSKYGDTVKRIVSENPGVLFF